MQNPAGRLRTLALTVLTVSSFAGLLVFAACTGLGGGGFAMFVDEGQSGASGSADIADACDSSDECAEGLRCIEHWGERFCVETCEFGAFCSDRSICKVAVNAPEDGWCDPGIVRSDSDFDDPDLDDSDDFDSGDDDDFEDDDSSPSSTDPEGGVGGPIEGECGSAVEARVITLLNEARREEGLRTLSCDGRLGDVARLHSEDMGVRDFFDHTNPDGEAPWDRMVNYGIDEFEVAGENIAAGYTTAADVHEGWMNSPGHRENILGEWYTHVGVGVWEEDGVIYWTQLFAAF